MKTLPKPHIKAERALTTRKRDGKPFNLRTTDPQTLVEKIHGAEILIKLCKKVLADSQDDGERTRIGKLLQRTERQHDALRQEAERRQSLKVGAA